MSPDPRSAQRSDSSAIGAPPDAAELSSPARENLGVIDRFADGAGESISGVQLWIERISTVLGSPACFLSAVLLIAGWVTLNGALAHLHRAVLDPPPFALLQAGVACYALILTIAVLIRQNRMTQLAEHRAHLDLQINLLAEQKATKVLEIVSELHQEMMRLRGKERPLEEVKDLTKPADPHALLDAIRQQTGNG